MLLLPQAGTKVASQESAAAKLDLYWIRDYAVCALLANTGGNFSEAVPDAAPNAWSFFGNAEQLPLSECRRPHEFVVVHKGHYAFLSNVIASLPALPGRNFSLTFCVNSNNTIRFSCYRVRHKNGETHFVAPTDYERVFFRGPVGLHESPRTFETLDYAYLQLIQNETECATFLTVSSYGVRTDSGDCVHLYHYALFKDYPEVWNWYEGYRDGVTDNAFYDCQFGSAPELWNYPTREEVSRCSDYAPRVACSTVSVDSEARAPYFYAGRDIGEMTQNSMDRESCHPHSTDDYGSSDSAGEYHGIYYTRAAKYGGGGVAVAVVGIILRILLRLYLCRHCCTKVNPRKTEKPLVTVSILDVPGDAIPMPPPPPRPSNSSNSTAGGVTTPPTV
ncbi:hypothetical protein V5799_031273 [Amblyomma americanum]|uniref:Uncharacterized protein n=1 Tax=Amblyomma americanum TaxID=6943 RepID=A0AAQ4ELS9_AMBAM